MPKIEQVQRFWGKYESYFRLVNFIKDFAMYGDLGILSISFQVEVFELKGFNKKFDSEFFKECFDSIVWLRRLKQRSYDGRGLHRFIR